MSCVVIPIDFPEGMSKQERIYHASRAICTASGAGGNAFPKTVCAPNERPVDSIGRYEKAKIAKLMQLGGWAGGGGGGGGNATYPGGAGGSGAGGNGSSPSGNINNGGGGGGGGQ